MKGSAQNQRTWHCADLPLQLQVLSSKTARLAVALARLALRLALMVALVVALMVLPLILLLIMASVVNRQWPQSHRMALNTDTRGRLRIKRHPTNDVDAALHDSQVKCKQSPLPRVGETELLLHSGVRASAKRPGASHRSSRTVFVGESTTRCHRPRSSVPRLPTPLSAFGRTLGWQFLVNKWAARGAMLVHIPRTGGTSLELANRVPATSHATLRDRRAVLAGHALYRRPSSQTIWRLQMHWQCDDRPSASLGGGGLEWLNVTCAILLSHLPTFAVVRNPFERAVSMWVTQQGGALKDNMESVRHANFKKWAARLSTWDGGAMDWWYRPQANYVIDENHECAVTYLLRFEKLLTSYASLRRQYPALGAALNRSQRAGILALRENRSHGWWCRYFDDRETASLVVQAFRVDFEMLRELYSVNVSVYCTPRGDGFG
jgi:hypothetical protein